MCLWYGTVWTMVQVWGLGREREVSAEVYGETLHTGQVGFIVSESGTSIVVLHEL